MEDGSVYPCHILGGVADFQVCTLESPAIAKLGTEQPDRFPGLHGVLGPNARLIAAAPELLQALEALLDMDISYQRGPKVQEAERAARLAVAKARGET